MQIFLVTFSFDYHGSHSGYDSLTHYMPNSTVINGQAYETLMKWINKRSYLIRKVGNRLLGRKRHWIDAIL